MDKGPSRIYVYGDWFSPSTPILVGTIAVNRTRGKEVLAFSYDESWLRRDTAFVLDPDLRFVEGPQYTPPGRSTFGIFLDSAPDRWGRVLMDRREAELASRESRVPRHLTDVDYLLGVHDPARLGGLRFKTDPEGQFLDDDDRQAAPPWALLRDLEYASLSLEGTDEEDVEAARHWLSILVAPGSSLGGARPKASVLAPDGSLWIAKFPSKNDRADVGAWELVVHRLAQCCGLSVPKARAERFSSLHHTYLCARFDRRPDGTRIHYASAMTMLGYTDGDAQGASYLDIAEFLLQAGATPDKDLPELWRRIAFSLLVSNTDDHLRNHGFLLSDYGWHLSPAFDINPNPRGFGLSLNISETDNRLDPNLVPLSV